MILFIIICSAKNSARVEKVLDAIGRVTSVVLFLITAAFLLFVAWWLLRTGLRTLP